MCIDLLPPSNVLALALGRLAVEGDLEPLRGDFNSGSGTGVRELALEASDLKALRFAYVNMS